MRSTQPGSFATQIDGDACDVSCALEVTASSGRVCRGAREASECTRDRVAVFERILRLEGDVPELYWLRESARDRLAWLEDVLDGREGLTVLRP